MIREPENTYQWLVELIAFVREQESSSQTAWLSEFESDMPVCTPEALWTDPQVERCIDREWMVAAGDWKLSIVETGICKACGNEPREGETEYCNACHSFLCEAHPCADCMGDLMDEAEHLHDLAMEMHVPLRPLGGY